MGCPSATLLCAFVMSQQKDCNSCLAVERESQAIPSSQPYFAQNFKSAQYSYYGASKDVIYFSPDYKGPQGFNIVAYHEAIEKRIQEYRKNKSQKK